ncbi:uncharacterized protein LOC116604554 [Nematostella vectensis]|uniref:uncharacterized protein LOC116604554 n=1 Tax=Nematostella vectensis TaxID=45351 RepID=UPI0013905EF9|nr:uncharacterized protein LOC116604554 [Nematostella vectensis]
MSRCSLALFGTPEKRKTMNTTQERHSVDVAVLDGAAIVNMLPPRKCKTFKEYSEAVFLPYVLNYSALNVKRIDLVRDRYFENKQGTREARGTGARRRVCNTAAIPATWKSFLRLDENKKVLFKFLDASVKSISVQCDAQVISTDDIDVVSHATVDKEGLAPSNHKEADTRILLHVKHASARGMKKVLIRTVDTDVVILAVAFARKLPVEELWVAFGVGKHLRYLQIHSMVDNLTTSQCEGLPFFHALTGCDTVSFFSRKGKKSAFQEWKLS